MSFLRFAEHSRHNEFAHRIALASPESLDDLRSVLVNASDPDRITIVSGEEMSARIAGTRNWDGYDASDYWDRRLEYLQRLSRIVRDFDDPQVYLCLRRADEFAELIYATMILSRGGRFRGPFEQVHERPLHRSSTTDGKSMRTAGCFVMFVWCRSTRYPKI